MRRKEKSELLGRAIDGFVDPEDEARLAELLRTDAAARAEYEEARIAHRALQDAAAEPMPAGLREEIRRAVEREARADASAVPPSLLARPGGRLAARLREWLGAAVPRRPWPAPRGLTVAAALVLVAFVVVALWQLVPERASAQRSIAVMGFRNETGDADLDYLREAIPNLLVTSLEQSGRFHVTTMQGFKDLARRTGADPGKAVFDEDTAFEICRRGGIDRIAIGSYTRKGDTIVMVVKVLDTASGRPVRTAESRGQGPASILRSQIDEIGRSVAGDDDGRPSEPAGSPSRVIDATTTSLEAYRDYLQGRDQLERFLFAEARRSLERAVAIDPSFAVAHLALAEVHGSLREYEDQQAALKEAERFASRATERERLFIEARHASLVENDADKRYRLLRDLVEKYPAEKDAHLELAGYYRERGLPSEALAETRKALDLDPGFGPALNQMAYTYVDLGEYEKATVYLERYAATRPGDPNPLDSIAELYLRTGRVEDAAAKYREVLAAHPDFVGSWLALAYVSALQEDYAETYRCVEEFTARAPSAGTKCEGRFMKAYYDYLLGRWDRSLEEYESLRRDMAEVPFWPGVTAWILGYVHADRGESGLALESFDAWASWLERDDPSNMVYYLVARALTRCHVELLSGSLDDAGEALSEAERLLPGLRGPDAEYKTYLARSCAAELALARDSVDVALSLAERIAPWVPSMDSASIMMANTPAFGDIRARAYWKKGDLDRAAAEYERITSRANDPGDEASLRLVHPLYHYRFGRVLEEKGDWSRARAEYEKFLAAWKDADPDHPETEDARRRLGEPRP